MVESDDGVVFAHIRHCERSVAIFWRLGKENMKHPAIYIITNKKNGTLYVGVTSNLVKRIYEHKESVIKGFASRYNCKILVYYESFDNIEQAIVREKQLKAGSRNKKVELIEELNPHWEDLYERLV